MRKILYLLLLMVGLAGCRSSKQAAGIAVPETAHYLSSRLQLTIPSGTNGSITTGGTMKMKGGERATLHTYAYFTYRDSPLGDNSR